MLIGKGKKTLPLRVVFLLFCASNVKTVKYKSI